MAHRGAEGAYGDLAERRAKMDAKYDKALEAGLSTWITATIGGEKLSDFQESLKSGVVLCKLMNALQPGAIKDIYIGGLAFKQMENISKFLSALPPYGLKSEDLFQTPDLFEGVNMTAVQVCLENVRRVSELKKSGVKVEAQQSQKGSLLIPAGKVSAAPAAAPKEVPASKPIDTRKFADPTSSKDGAYGDLAERQAKLEAKYDHTLEAGLRSWIESKTGESIGADFQAGLKNGEILCRLANILRPGSIKSINKATLAFKQMENINFFLDFARNIGVRGDDLFQTVALFEGSNMTQVLQTLDNVRRITSS